ISMVDIRDVAEVSANVLTTEGHESQTYVLTGPATVSMNDLAGALSTALGKQVNYVNVPIAATRESLIGMGLSDWMADTFCEYFENHSNGGSNFLSDDVEKITGHPPIGIERFAQDFAPYFSG
ncbi:MAG: SDR family NAD(P)-dependent oxidoreductase, partial [Anaerolineae bacterium]|nr:SDR family NAD(P)-dependent oxidoreductase [Anaerolineae bacterium]